MIMKYRTQYGLDVSVEIVRDEHACVIVHAPMYMRKQWEMRHCYSLEYSDSEVMADIDFLRVMSQAYPKD